MSVMLVDNTDDPATYEEAMMSPDSNKWQEAMKSEIGSMYENQVWTLVDLPDGRKAVENKWIDRKSTRLNSSHPSISYAVFCLKKKNKITYMIYSTTYT